MIEKCLGCVISTSDCREIFVTLWRKDPDRDNLLNEDCVIQTECIGVQVVISFSWWIIGGTSFWPLNVFDRWCGQAV
jgi:hypothetical protein